MTFRASTLVLTLGLACGGGPVPVGPPMERPVEQPPLEQPPARGDVGTTGADFRLSALQAPPADRDGDGLADAVDRCPDLPGTAQGGRAGCPVAVYVQVTGRRIQLLQPIAFKPNGYVILPRSRPILDQVGAVLRSRRSIRVEVQGHYKPLGYGMRLSRRRAQAVQRYLVRKGIAISRVEAKGYGESRPLAPPHTAAGRARNWRIEIQILRGSAR